VSDQPQSLFSDFWPRMITGLLMAVTGLYAVWLGGPVYVGMIFLIAGILIWELAVMLDASLMRQYAKRQRTWLRAQSKGWTDLYIPV
jgi:CDP-diglyceride synthetase